MSGENDQSIHIEDPKAFADSFLRSDTSADDIKALLEPKAPEVNPEADTVNPDVNQDTAQNTDTDDSQDDEGNEPATPVAENQDAAKQEDDTPSPEHPKKPRVKITTKEESEVIQLMKENGITLIEAAELYRMRNQPAQTAKTEPESKRTPQDPPQEPSKPVADAKLQQFDSTIEKLQADIADVEKELQEAEDDLEVQKIASLSVKLSKLQSNLTGQEIRRENYVEQSEARAQAAYDSAYIKAEQEVFQKYPALENADSQVGLAFEAFFTKRAQIEPQLFDNPSWITALADEFSEKYGIEAASDQDKPGKPTEAVSRKPGVPNTAPKKQQVQNPAKMVNGSDGKTSPSSSAAGLNKDEVMKEFQNLPPDEKARVISRAFSGSSVLNRDWHNPSRASA